MALLETRRLQDQGQVDLDHRPLAVQGGHLTRGSGWQWRRELARDAHRELLKDLRAQRSRATLPELIEHPLGPWIVGGSEGVVPADEDVLVDERSGTSRQDDLPLATSPLTEIPRFAAMTFARVITSSSS